MVSQILIGRAAHTQMNVTENLNMAIKGIERIMIIYEGLNKSWWRTTVK